MHPHRGASWFKNNLTIQRFSAESTEIEDVINTAYGTSNYGFYSFRFPGTHGSLHAFQAVANRGYKISANYGRYTGMSPLGSIYSNGLWFPKQKILYDAKTNMIEMECPVMYDMDAPSAAQFYTASISKMPNFLNVNYPSNYILGGHIQVAMMKPDYINNVSKILNYLDNNTAYTSYEDLGTLALYESAMQNANIKVTSVGNIVAAQVTTTTPIVNFTLKLTNITDGIHAQYDDVDLDVNNVIYEDGVYYVYHTIGTGTHTLKVTDEKITGTYGFYVGKGNVASLKVKGTDYKVINNAHNTSKVNLATNELFIPGPNIIQNGQNNLCVDGHVVAIPIDATITPYTGAVNVTVSKWNTSGDYIHIWNESYANHKTATIHDLGGFPANTQVVIYQNNVYYTTVISNYNGYIQWTYPGSYSDQQFTAMPNRLVAGMP